MRVAGMTDVGLKRENNQDHFLVDDELGLFVVADGMGGHQGGEVASQLAVQAIHQTVKEFQNIENPQPPREVLQKAYASACEKIFKRSLETSNLKGMGTTAVTALLKGQILYLANVGDSRAYLIHPPHIWQISEDHSLLNEQIRAGLVRPEHAAVFAAKNVITRSVGFEEYVTCDVIERKLQEGDYILLCSDGLSGMISDRRIGDVCLTLPFEEVAPRLVEEAKRNGGDDNITVIFLGTFIESEASKSP